MPRARRRSRESRANERPSLASQANALRCMCLLFFELPLACITALIIFLSAPEMPKFYINELYVPALHISPDNPFSNITRTSHTIFFDLKLQNSMDYKGVRYHSLNLTFFFYIPVHNTTTSSATTTTNGTAPAPPLLLANYTVPGFYQGYGSAAMRRGVVVTPQGQLPWWDEAIRAVSGGSTVVFRVDLAATMKFKYIVFYTWSTKKVKDIGAIVEIDGSGRKAHKDAVQFIHSAA